MIITKEQWARRYATAVLPRVESQAVAADLAQVALAMGIADQHPIPEQAAEIVAEQFADSEGGLV